MNTATREAVLTSVLDLLHQLARDWEYSGEIAPDTLLFADLGFESIDAVVLASFVQERYGRPFPFPQLLAEMGAKQVKDLRISELVEFIHTQLKGDAAGVG